MLFEASSLTICYMIDVEFMVKHLLIVFYFQDLRNIMLKLPKVQWICAQRQVSLVIVKCHLNIHSMFIFCCTEFPRYLKTDM